MYSERVQTAIKRGEAWFMPFDAIDPTTSDDQFVHIRNNDKQAFEIFEISVQSTVAGMLEPAVLTGSSTTPTDVKANMTNLSGKESLPVGLFETGVDLNMTLAKKQTHIYLAANTPRVIETAIRIPRGTDWGLNWDTATGILTGHIGLMLVAPSDE